MSTLGTVHTVTFRTSATSIPMTHYYMPKTDYTACGEFSALLTGIVDDSGYFDNHLVSCIRCAQWATERGYSIAPHYSIRHRVGKSRD